MYGPLRDLTCRKVIGRLEELGVVANGPDAASGPDGFTLHLSSGGRYFPMIFAGDLQLVFKEDLAAILDRFELDYAEFMEPFAVEAE